MRTPKTYVREAGSRTNLNQPPLQGRGKASEVLCALLRILAMELKLAAGEQNFDNAPANLNPRG